MIIKSTRASGADEGRAGKPVEAVQFSRGRRAPGTSASGAGVAGDIFNAEQTSTGTQARKHFVYEDLWQIRVANSIRTVGS